MSARIICPRTWAPLAAAVALLAGCAGAGGWVSVTIPYDGYAMAMTLLVPDSGEYDALLDRLDAGAADLSGINGRQDLFVATLVHQAVISVDENGTEAAAATGAAVAESAAPVSPTQLTVDRPFLYWISDTTTGAPLFLGTVTDPSTG